DLGADRAMGYAEGDAARRCAPQYDDLSRNWGQHGFARRCRAAAGSCRRRPLASGPHPGPLRLRKGDDRIRICRRAKCTEQYESVSQRGNLRKGSRQTSLPRDRSYTALEGRVLGIVKNRVAVLARLAAI